MKLASLGLRGVAANILWGYANHYKKVEDWDKVELTVNQIIRLQPNFLKVWDFQSHNLSYNISAEFDDYRMRYAWVKKGIAFLIEGTSYNRNEPGLLSNIGWFVGQKIGRADEKTQFREMFKDDTDFHQVFRENGVEVDQVAAHGPPEPGKGARPDNWLVSRLWYAKATDAVTSLNKPIRGMAPVLFYGRVPMSQINAADAMQKDGHFFQIAQQAWVRASEEWRDFGDRELATASGFSVRMNDQEQLQEHIQQLHKEIDKVAPGLDAKLRAEKLPSLDAEQRAALDKPAAERNLQEQSVAAYAESRIMSLPEELLDRAPREARPQVRRLVDQILDDERHILEIRRNRNVVAFEYWRTRVQAERTPEARQARSDVYAADKLFSQGVQFEEARKLYEKAWDAWAVIFKLYPELIQNAEAQDLIDSIARYRDLLGQLDQPFPADFKLNDLLDSHHDGLQLREQIRLIQGSGETKPETPKPDQPQPNGSPKPDDPNAKPDEDKPAENKPAEEKPAEVKPEAPKSSEPKAGSTDSDEAAKPGV
jgi:hypothetical protein